ncbi:Nickel/cobalt efflux system (plasmid) [Cupriavidus necator]|uniref:HoxN/HupN/NixA family nickel/cobalt transporter n=1 Tax=Cupriavidus necator TaxID=106590 RepID=UPI003F7407B1
MRPILSCLLDDSQVDARSRTRDIYAVLLAVNVGTWGLAIFAFHGNPMLLGTALLAYTLGLRHAVDADHLAAIDNVARKLMQEHKTPLAVGFMFSLGHSTVVLFGSIAIVMAASALHQRTGPFREIGGMIGIGVSAGFLIAIALMNLVVLRSLCRAWWQLHTGKAGAAEEPDHLLNGRGLLARLYRPMFRMVTRSWHMYPLGLLFGLGFDTATEIGLLGIAATEASKGLPLASILLFPLLFAAGMALVDTTDGILMLGAYGWALDQPVRKLYYNMSVTFLSVIIAIMVGVVQVTGVAARLESGSAFWLQLGKANDKFGLAGLVIMGTFVLVWSMSALAHKLQPAD